MPARHGLRTQQAKRGESTRHITTEYSMHYPDLLS